MSVGSANGFGNTGPFPGTIFTSISIACGMTRISEKMIEASRSNLLRGCIVTSIANSGVWQIVKKSHNIGQQINQTDIVKDKVTF